MANYTSNYNLKKPLPEEFYNIDDHNGNMDIIDEELKKIATATSNASEQIANHNADGSAHPDIRSAVSDAKQSASQALIDAKSYTDQKISAIPTPDVSGQINAHNTSSSAHSDIRTLVNDTAATVNSKVDNHIANTSNPHAVTASQVGALPSTGGNVKGELGVAYSTFTRNNPNARAVVKQGTDGDIGFYNELETDVYCGLRVQPITADTTDISNHIRFRVRNNNYNHMYKLYGSHNLEDLATSLGAARIQTGTYDGTNTSGESNPCSVTLDFEPKLFAIYAQITISTGAIAETLGYGFRSVEILTTEYKGVWSPIGNTRDGNMGKVSADRKTIYWYGSSAAIQGNASGRRYYWVAIG